MFNIRRAKQRKQELLDMIKALEEQTAELKKLFDEMNQSKVSILQQQEEEPIPMKQIIDEWFNGVDDGGGQ